MRDSAARDWPRVVASGALWTLVYNLCWGIGWFAFMREEWVAAFAAIHRTSLWTAELWFVWVLMTVPLGIAIMAYSAGRPHRARSAALASVALWALMTFGMFGWGLGETFSLRLMTWDSLVNLAAMLLASLAAAWSQSTLPPESSKIVP